MGIYSDAVFGPLQEFTIKDTIESIMEDSSIPVYEDDNLISEGLIGICVMNENYNNIMKHIGISELRAIETTGEEMVYTEGILSSLWNTLKKFVLKVWDRIKSLFKHFMMIIDGYMKKDKEFCNKYRKQIFAYHDLSDFTFKGYKWTIDTGEFDSACKALSAKANEAFTKSGSNVDKSKIQDTVSGMESNSQYDETSANKVMERFDDDVAEPLRGHVLALFKSGKGKDGKYTADEFRKELKACFRNGEESKEELDDKDFDVGDMFNDLFTSAKTKKDMKEYFKSSKKEIDDTIKVIDRLEKEHINNQPQTLSDTEAEAAEKAAKAQSDEEKKTARDNALKVKTTGAKYASKRYAYFSRVAHLTHEILLTMNSTALDALKERSRQFKACLTKIVYHKGKSESAYTESAYDREPSAYGTDFISSIEFK